MKTKKSLKQKEKRIAKALETRLGRFDLSVEMVKGFSIENQPELQKHREFLQFHGTALDQLDKALAVFVKSLRKQGHEVRFGWVDARGLQDLLETKMTKRGGRFVFKLEEVPVLFEEPFAKKSN
jgi:hypothetical protein